MSMFDKLISISKVESKSPIANTLFIQYIEDNVVKNESMICTYCFPSFAHKDVLNDGMIIAEEGNKIIRLITKEYKKK